MDLELYLADSLHSVTKLFSILTASLQKIKIKITSSISTYVLDDFKIQGVPENMKLNDFFTYTFPICDLN